MKVNLSIIILNYNRKHDSIELIKSIKKQSYKLIEIILVDNNSSDDSVAFVGNKFKDVRIIKLTKNIGRAGHNKGAQAAKGEILVFLDADTYFTDIKFMSRLINKFVNKNINAVSFFMKDPSGKTYGWEPNYIVQDNLKLGYESTFGGGMWAIRKKIFDKIGGFNPDFFVYVDEWEYLIRLWDKDYSVRYFPDLIGYHKETPYAYRSVMKGYHVIINHIQLLTLYIPFSYWPKFFKHYTKQTASIIKSGDANRKSSFQGIIFVLFYLLKSLPKRRPVKNKTVKKFLHFYFPQKGDVVVGKWGWGIK